MNRRYIDFVPVDKKTAPRGAVSSVKTVKNGNALPVRKGAPKRMSVKKPAVREPEELPIEELFEEKTRPAGVSTGLFEPKFGVIEDYSPKFVRTEVVKRPLGAKKPISVGGTTNRVTPVKKSIKPVAKPAVKPMVRTAPKAAPKAKTTIEGPRITKFLNTNKIEKRPLSKTYAKNLVPAVQPVVEEKPEKRKKKSPERIITKPDKDSKAGMIIAVILTIILGAAAGTVAFLLLPK